MTQGIHHLPLMIFRRSFLLHLFGLDRNPITSTTRRRRKKHHHLLHGDLPFSAIGLLLILIAFGSLETISAAVRDGRTALMLSSRNYSSDVERGTSSSSSSGASAASSMSGVKISSGCPPSASRKCLRCSIEGCIKCPNLLVTDTRKCVEVCPSGYSDQWSSHPDFMGRVCITTGISGPLLAALAGLFGGFFVCLSLLAVAIVLVKRKRRRKTIKQKLINENTMDRSDFLRQLNDMRPNAEYFLGMLNDTRRQIRKLYLSGDAAAANSYRPIVRDLAKILILLNRPIELIPAPPHDWNRIYAWSEQALDRYKPQVGQLIDFFQSNGQSDDPLRDSPYKQTTFKNTNSQSNSPHKMQLFGSLISLHEFEEPRASDPFGSSFNTLKGNLITDLNQSSLWLEDEFFKLGFRPQDEITTEL
ncbi:uncharacterized protein LOC129916718 [Episyrphus balteatus]|uniref:uncharacterized protein LOC129916718 n=1 Tax=Episyrphus balteatus TaxID=286459 RepID=UPI002486320D|nr:uncharacterized protein LOC129916718 [Episyrphus balteatus]